MNLHVLNLFFLDGTGTMYSVASRFTPPVFDLESKLNIELELIFNPEILDVISRHCCKVGKGLFWRVFAKKCSHGSDPALL